MYRYGMFATLDRDHFYDSIDEALREIDVIDATALASDRRRGSRHSMTSRQEPKARTRRIAALISLVAFVTSVVFVALTASRSFPRGLIAAVLLILAFVAVWEASLRRGAARTILAIVGVLLVIGFVVALVVGEIIAEVLILALLLGVVAVTSRWAFRIHVPLPFAEAPKRPVVVWNPRSGGGKAAAVHLDEQARARGIEPIELRPGDDLVQLVRDAVANGADALAAAGGDGTQALVATIAAELDLPFACIPAGTRNHFALDLGVDRDDVVGALDAFVNGGERRVDLAEVNGRVFVNNVSLGLYAQAVQHAGYRDAKLRTVLDTMPDFGGSTAGQHPLVYSAPDDAAGACRADRGHGVQQLLPVAQGGRFGHSSADRRRSPRHCGAGDSCRPHTTEVHAVGGSDVRGRLRWPGACRGRW